MNMFERFVKSVLDYLGLTTKQEARDRTNYALDQQRSKMTIAVQAALDLSDVDPGILVQGVKTRMNDAENVRQMAQYNADEARRKAAEEQDIANQARDVYHAASGVMSTLNSMPLNLASTVFDLPREPEQEKTSETE